jgi:hypothetical protein
MMDGWMRMEGTVRKVRQTDTDVMNGWMDGEDRHTGHDVFAATQAPLHSLGDGGDDSKYDGSVSWR